MSVSAQQSHFRQGLPVSSTAVDPTGTPTLPLAMGPSTVTTTPLSVTSAKSDPVPKKKSRRNTDSNSQKRRCISTACVACRKRKSKCDGALPSCAACASVYCTECVYDPNSDHRRKGVYREKVDSMKAQNSTLQILIEAILNADEDDVLTIVKKIRTCDSLDAVAESIVKEEFVEPESTDEGPFSGTPVTDGISSGQPVEGEFELARKMGELRLENGSVRFIGGTSHLIYLGDPSDNLTGGLDGLSTAAGTTFAPGQSISSQFETPYLTAEEALNSWTTVTRDKSLIIHLMNMYFNWHYTYFTTLSKSLFYRDFLRGRPQVQPNHTVYCSSLLVNAMLALGCHFTGVSGAFAIAGDSRTKGDHFFAEAKRLIVDNDEYEKPRLATVQALALMSVREAGCAREAKGWVYSGMSFRMAQDIGLNMDAGGRSSSLSGVEHDDHQLSEGEIDARRITFWGCFLFDKAWSNYMGRLPQLPKNSYNVPKYDVFPDEDAELWSPYTDAGFDTTLQQPSRTRANGLQLSKLCEISSDLLLFFYHPNHIGRSSGKAVELKKLSELHRRLEDWRRELPREFEPKDGQLPNVILTHMFFHLQYIHLFRPFLKYSPTSSPLPPHVSPRRICTANAGAISKLMRLYKKTYNLRQICNIAVYMIHSACTIHLLNLPEKTAKRDIIHGVKQLEEIAEDWLCARRTLCIISVLARKWGVELPDEASAVLQRSDEKYGSFNTADVPSPNRGFLGAGSALQSSSTSPPPLQSIDGQAVSLSMSAVNQGGIVTTPVTPQYEAISQNSQAFLQDLTSSPLSPDYLVSLQNLPVSSSGAVEPVHGTAPMVQAFSGNGNIIGNTALPMGGNVSGWTMGQSVQPVQTVPPSIRGYTQASTAQSRAMQTANAGQFNSSIFGLDDGEWLLKEGASWQHNFHTWGLGQQQQTSQPQQSPQVRQSAERAQQSHKQTHVMQTDSPPSAGNGGTPMSDNSLYMLRGLQNNELDLSFESLGGTGTSLDGLGLD